MTEIEWIDTLCLSSWSIADEDLKCPVVKSVGYMVRETKDTVVLAGMIGEDGTVNAVQVIPKGCIVKRRKV